MTDDELKELIVSLAVSQKETDRLFKETDKQFKEIAKESRATDKQLKERKRSVPLFEKEGLGEIL